MSKELLVLEKLEVVPFFTKGDSLDETLAKIEDEALAFVASDLSVGKNRDAVKAMVTKVTKSKTYLEKEGKKLTDEYKAIPKAIDANRKRVKEFLTELQAKVRQPLTDWEIEDDRIKAEKAEAERLAEIAERIELIWDFAHIQLNQFNLGVEWCDWIVTELQRERDEEIARVAAEKAKADAEEKAKADIEAAKQLAAKAEQDAINAENKRIADAKQAEVKRVADVKAAEDKERQRQVDAKAAEDKAIADRKARTDYVAGIKTSQKLALMGLGADEKLAIAIVKAMHAEELPNIKVIY